MDRRRKIMVLIDWYLPGVKGGGPVRSIYSMVNLLREVDDFTVVTSAFDLGATQPYHDISAGEVFEMDHVQFYYSPRRALATKELLHLIRALRPDCIYLNSFWSFPFAIRVLLLKRIGLIFPRVVLAPRGMLGKGALSLKSSKKRIFLTLAKFLRLHRNITFHATQQQEAADIRDLFPGATVEIAPNLNSASLTHNTSVKKPGELQLFFLSRISPVKNLHFALRALSAVNGKYRIEYDIYGNIEDAAYWEECLKLISEMPAHVKVRFKGELPFHEVQEVISSYHGLFLPTLNENFGHSIVESLMCGCLVILSDQTPWNAISAHGGFALPLSDAAGFTECIEKCASFTEDEFRKRSNSARKFIAAEMDLANAAVQYQKLFYGEI